MGDPFLSDSLAVQARTPAALNALLRDLPEAWTSATEGDETWSPREVLSHLIHAEETDWVPRVRIILEEGPARAFAPFDRTARLREDGERPLAELLDEFSALRRTSLEVVRNLWLTDAQLRLTGTHPALGVVTLRQLLATWTAHDLAHMTQVTRVMAKRYRDEVGPWEAYLSVMRA